ncbi:MAG: hypothetical protein RJA98_3985 [Pseudomonadota bacterium]
MPLNPAQQLQADDLRRMKALALGLLLAAAALELLAQWRLHLHPLWPWVAAFAEAAMVGACADWFAVVALFRHPLGLPIPHTAIVPRNKERIGRNLAAFVCDHFLRTDTLLPRLTAWDAPAKLGRWLAEPAHSAQVGEHLVGTARQVLQALEPQGLQALLRDTLLGGLQRLDLSLLAGQLLDGLTTDRRHQAVLDEVLQQLAHFLDDEAVQARLADSIAAEVKVLRYVGLDAVAGKVATTRLLAAFGQLVGQMGEDEAHPLRLRFDVFMQGFIERLKTDPALRLRIGDLQAQLLSHPALAGYLHELLAQFLGRLGRDLDTPDSPLRRHIAQAAQGVGLRLQSDAALREAVNTQLLRHAPGWIDHSREALRRTITERVDAWDSEALSAELERNIGRDLQYVRINGTLVGGLIGLLIHAVSAWFHHG